MPSRSHARRGTAVALLLALVASGCSDTDAGTTARDRAAEVVDAVKNAVAKAREGNDTASGAVDAGQAAPIRADTRTAFDYDQYTSTLGSVISSLEDYWATALPASFGARYSSPQRFVYYRSDQQPPGPTCGEEPAPANNAFYCPAGDFIAWDETGLIIPLYVQAGDFAAGFVLAHEFGHAMQARLPQQEQVGVLRELQADCFAGSWSAHVQEQGLLEAGDLDEATLAVFSARDVPGTAWTDPRAHGSGFERTRAFTDGYESGPKACYPAPAEDWIVEAAGSTGGAATGAPTPTDGATP